MRTVDFPNWQAFLQHLELFFSKRPDDREGFVFRGQADAQWELDSTLQRFVRLHCSGEDEAAVSTRLRAKFRELSAGQPDDPGPLDPLQFELLARHHGLPSNFIDWTRSPYVAAYFAYADALHDTSVKPAKLAIWAIDLSSVGASDPLEVVQGYDAVRINPRAVEQQAVFLRVPPGVRIEQVCDSGIRKFTLPSSERSAILDRLSAMRITHATLFRSLDAAAATAARHVRSVYTR
jgi:hypothetical protein